MWYRFCFLLVVISAFSTNPSESKAQFDPALFFRYRPEPVSPDTFAGYTWFLLSPFGHQITSPGGTTLSSPFERANFKTFEDFENDVLGQWQIVITATGETVTFEINHIPPTVFPPVELVSPVDGETFFSSEIIQTLTTPPEINLDGISLFTVGASSTPLGTSQFQSIVNPGTMSASVVVERHTTIDVDNVITAIKGDVIAIPLREEIFSGIYTNNASITVVPNFGDINLDGFVDLSDVAPFATLLVNGEYQIEADINLDATVDLLDVEPFVTLLTGG